MAVLVHGEAAPCGDADATQVLGLFVWELVYTFMRFGSAWSTWKTPFPILLDRGAPAGTRGVGDVESKSAIPMSTNPSGPTHPTAQTAPLEA